MVRERARAGRGRGRGRGCNGLNLVEPASDSASTNNSGQASVHGVDPEVLRNLVMDSLKEILGQAPGIRWLQTIGGNNWKGTSVRFVIR
ncbi:unnamed protein product [Arabis nemorensis]|uniref:Uncharacterized protein n=1 Tax=Arabis nemorensis TaxID=586526 RepID=A0A565CD43_9BRAS|nr:unnamed protein product [Arabis nemorensis]